jgi:hypothetical protein
MILPISNKIIKYIIGIIADEKNNNSVSTKDRVAIGQLYHDLTALNTKLTINFIDNVVPIIKMNK